MIARPCWRLITWQTWAPLDTPISSGMRHSNSVPVWMLHMMILQHPWWVSARIISQLLGSPLASLGHILYWLAALGVCGCTTKPPRPIDRHRPSFDLPTCFAQWLHLSKFRAMCKTTQQHGRQLKRARYLDQIQQAECAAQAHNPYVLYRASSCTQTQADQVKPGDFCACLQVSVDLSQAFDTAPWDLLELALDRTGAPLELKALDHGLD